ncbi:hypothetical protein BMASAVP1_A2872 [Burkholderia mallei SAVP1]|nr:hypothetical protein BMASAVP1_A2872 [Burkholderia mallei SAVP1]
MSEMIASDRIGANGNRFGIRILGRLIECVLEMFAVCRFR